MSKRNIALLPMAQLLALSITNLVEMAREGVEMVKETKELISARKSSTPAVGKVYAALKRKFNEDQDRGSNIVATFTFEEFIKAHTKAKKVDNHALSCAKCFGFFVGHALITEADYDKNPGDNLEKSASIVDAVKMDVTAPEITEAADILKDRPKDAAKKLQAIIDKLKGPREVSVEKAKEYLALIFANGHHMLVLAASSAEMTYIDDPKQLDHYAGQIQLMAQTTQRRLVELTSPKPAAPVAPANMAPAKPAAAPVPAAPVAPVAEPSRLSPVPTSGPSGQDYENWLAGNVDMQALGEDYKADAIDSLKQYHAAHGCLPPTAEDFFTFSEALEAQQQAA